jgi:hypothetical protein
MKLTQTEFFVAKPGPKNFGYYPQDSFSKDSNMERVETNVKTGDNLNFALNLGIYSTKAIAEKEEIFYEYGRAESYLHVFERYLHDNYTLASHNIKQYTT